MSIHGWMIRDPEVERRRSGVRRWSVAWGLYFPDSMRFTTRRRLFFTQRGAERWIESKRIKPKDRWKPLSSPVERTP